MGTTTTTTTTTKTTTTVTTLKTTTPTTTTRLTTTDATTILFEIQEVIRNANIATTTTASTTTTSENASPKTLGELVATALSQSAAPLAGLSAATIAYGAAAMLPVWLPLALVKKRKRKRRSSFPINASS